MHQIKIALLSPILALFMLGCAAPNGHAQGDRGLALSAPAGKDLPFKRLTPEAWVVQQIGGAVVSIQATTQRRAGRSLFDEFFLRPSAKSQGSGVVIAKEGYIITNYHVVGGASEIEVHFNEKYDSRHYRAELIDHRPDEDLALLRITRPAGHANDFPFVHLGRSDDLMIGEKVIAIGNPYGKANTVSSGILSATGREITVQDPFTGQPRTFADLLQTDASINPGNSGGPLLNVHAELIGINNAIMPRAQGISFAIPVNKVVEILSTQFFNVNSSDRFDLGFKVIEKDGRLVADQLDPQSEAARAGLRGGDQIIALAGVKTADIQSFSRAVLNHKPGDRVPLAIRRGQAQRELRLRLTPFQPEVFLWRRFGVHLESYAIRDGYGYRYHTLRVREVRKGSLAGELGLEPDDLLLRVGPSEDTVDRRLRPMTSPAEVVTYMRDSKGNKAPRTLWISIYRPSERSYLKGDFEI